MEQIKIIKLYQVDAFTDKLFGGNPAAVCRLDKWLNNELLQNIAAENFLPETAFFVSRADSPDNHFDIKWFTPEIEMDLCGHATLATAHVIFNHFQLNTNKIIFNSNSGQLIVEKQNDLIILDFPSRMPVEVELPEIILNGIGIKPIETLKSRDYVLLYDNEDTVRNITPNQQILNEINLGTGGIIVTAKANKENNGIDFVSRFFTPQSSILEDPVTGSAHCSLIPYWSKRLNKTEMIALQVSKRVGKLYCENFGDRVLISGKCKTYLEGQINIYE
ncbi:unnamed protein product [Didymodactylos carnosus]|uniref:Phenazine biosynthesis PhzC/PhzF protein n=1 Tax=Didymodactylos carnosus TaxID=1234261 RepID=A0A8S2TU28_9BILA|nr:unnamed protein product [Didymodactylos carnosus]CAF4307274.1 unnamed protein product [Didymodactylos carnosus]